MNPRRSFRPLVEALEDRQVLSTVGTPTQNFVDQVYQDVLHRAADSSGLANFSAAIDSGQMTRSQFVLMIELSAEGRNTIVNDVFTRFLHRSADVNGLSYWTSFLGQGHSTAELENAIANSNEYIQMHGGGGQTYINALFEDFLGRDPGPNDQTNPIPVLSMSPEGRQHQAMGYYTSYLRRPGDAAGLAYWTSNLEQEPGTMFIGPASNVTMTKNSDAIVVAQMLGSNEYYQNSQTNESASTIPTTS